MTYEELTWGDLKALVEREKLPDDTVICIMGEMGPIPVEAVDKVDVEHPRSGAEVPAVILSEDKELAKRVIKEHLEGAQGAVN